MKRKHDSGSRFLSIFSRIIALFIIFVFVLNTAYGAGSKLIFSDVDVKVGGKTSKNVVDGERIDEEAKPGDNIEFKIEVKNNFTRDEDLEIEDITVEATIEEIEDNDDFEEESSDFDLDADRDKRVTLRFQVPLEVEEDTFDVVITAEGEDKNGTDHKATMRLKLEVDKENHLLKITKKSIVPEKVDCNRNNVQIVTTLINIGNEDEEDVIFYLINQNLGLNIRDAIGELKAEPNEKESIFSKIYPFNVPNEVKEGSYPITLKAVYDKERKKVEESIILTVTDCPEKKVLKVLSSDKVEENKEESEVKVITSITGKAVTGAVTGATESKAKTTIPDQDNTVIVETKESFLKSNLILIGIMIAEIIVIIVGIVLLISFFRSPHSTVGIRK